jgi:hypothetical protein
MKGGWYSVSTRLLGLNVGYLMRSTSRRSNTKSTIDAFIRDELSKGRYDPAISRICFEMLLELFGRVLKIDLGERVSGDQKVEDVC